jgi:hypothetical protein
MLSDDSDILCWRCFSRFSDRGVLDKFHSCHSYLRYQFLS